MIRSLITTSGVAFKQQPKKDLPNFFKRRIRAKLGHRQRVRRFCQLVDLIVIRKLKSDFHSVHRHGAIVAKASLPIPEQARVDAKDMFVVRVRKGFISQVNSLVEKSLRLVFGHRAIVGQGGVVGHSYIPRVFAMPTSSLFLPIGSYPNASELFGGLRK